MISAALLTALLILALVFNFVNGFQDSANTVATMIASKAMTPRAALLIAAVGNFIGPFILGSAVASTIGNGLVVSSAMDIEVILAALVSAGLWGFLTWFFGIPSSASHALVGGIIGSVLIHVGHTALIAAGLVKIMLALFISPIAGFIFGLLVMRVTMFLVNGSTPKINIFFKNIQIPTAFLLSISHGSNDAQKTIGIITMGLVTLGYQNSFEVPLWVTLVSSIAIALGTALGGFRVIRTLGIKLYKIRPIHSFTSQLSSSAVIIFASIIGGPVSTTQVVSTSILGVGAAQRKSQIRWGVMSNILAAWLLTIPITAGLGALFYLVFRAIIS